MTMNKQTIWLVTMLTLMVVLSAYYIVTGPVEPVTQTGKKEQQEETKVNVNVKAMNKQEEASGKLSKHDFFINYHLQRDTLRSKMTEEYMRTLSDPEATKNELQDAEARINQLMKVDKQESTAEEMIRREGYRDAVVINQNDKVDVVVQSDKLDESQVVSIISIIGQHFHISPTQVSVGYKS